MYKSPIANNLNTYNKVNNNKTKYDIIIYIENIL